MPIPDDPTFDRFVRATRKVEQGEQGGAALGTPGPGGPRAECRVTSATADGNGHYPAVVTVFNGDTLAWTDYETVKLRPLNGETLTNGTRYPARAAGVNGSDNVWLVTDVPSAGGGSITLRESDLSPTGSVTIVQCDQATGVGVSSVSAGTGTIYGIAATTTQQGVVTTGAQSWAGNKFFTGSCVGTATNAQFIAQVGGAGSIASSLGGMIYGDTGNAGKTTFSASAGGDSISLALEINYTLNVATVYLTGNIGGTLGRPDIQIHNGTAYQTGFTGTITIQYKDHASVNKTATIVVVSGLITSVTIA